MYKWYILVRIKNMEAVIMPVPKSNQKAVNKYVKTNYDRVNVTMPKGKREAIQKHAQRMGESANAFINRAIEQQMQRDNEK